MELRKQVIEKMQGVFGSDGKRINHALNVLKYAEEIMAGERIEGRDAEVILLAAVLHDIGIQEAERKYNSNSGRFQEIEGPPIAKVVMEALGVDKAINERVCYIIGGHHTWSKNDGKDFQIIWESDLLVNIEDEGAAVFGNNINVIIDKNFKTETGKGIARKNLIQK